jgi:hypothetical protein
MTSIAKKLSFTTLLIAIQFFMFAGLYPVVTDTSAFPADTNFGPYLLVFCAVKIAGTWLVGLCMAGLHKSLFSWLQKKEDRKAYRENYFFALFWWTLAITLGYVGTLSSLSQI